MVRKTPCLWITLIMILIGCALSACSPATSSFHEKTPVATSTPEQPFVNFTVLPSWHSIAQGRNVNNTSSTLTPLATFPAQKSIIVRAQCRGTGHFTINIQPSTDVKPLVTIPLSCKTAKIGELDYNRLTIPQNEQDQVILFLEGNIEWQAIVEAPNA